MGGVADRKMTNEALNCLPGNLSPLSQTGNFVCLLELEQENWLVIRWQRSLIAWYFACVEPEISPKLDA